MMEFISTWSVCVCLRFCLKNTAANCSTSVGEHVVELVIGEVILGLAVAEGVAEFDVVERVAFDKHVGAADGVGFGVVVLAEEDELGVGVELLEAFGGGGEHAAGAAGGVVE